MSRSLSYISPGRSSLYEWPGDSVLQMTSLESSRGSLGNSCRKYAASGILGNNCTGMWPVVSWSRTWGILWTQGLPPLWRRGWSQRSLHALPDMKWSQQVCLLLRSQKPSLPGLPPLKSYVFCYKPDFAFALDQSNQNICGWSQEIFTSNELFIYKQLGAINQWALLKEKS